MRNIFILTISFFLSTFGIYSQTTLWGLGHQGIFEYNQVTNTLTDRYIFPTTGAEGSTPVTKMIVGSNGKLYYTMLLGGVNNFGTVNVFDPVTNTNTVILHFNGVNGKLPDNALVEGNNNKLYGATSSGGANDKGVIFEIDMITNTYTKLYDGNNTHKTFIGDLIIDNDTIIGTESAGLFQYAIATNSITTLCPNPTSSLFFGVTIYFNSGNGVIKGADNNYYTYTAVFNNSYIYPVILKYDKTTGVVTKNEQSTYIGSSSNSRICGKLELASNNQMYGYNQSGHSSTGQLIKYDYVNDIYSVAKYFNSSTTPGYYSSPLDIGDDFIYGVFSTPNSSVNYIHKIGAYGANFGVETFLPFSGNSSIISPLTTLTEVAAPPLISSQPNNVNTCEGVDTSVAIVAIGTNLTYQWYKDGNSIPETDSIIYFVNPTSSDDGYYHCEITNANGTTVSDSSLVVINPKPNVIANATPSALCTGDSLLLVGTGASTYSWDNGVANGIPFLPTGDNTYLLTGTAANGCSDTASLYLPINNISVSFIDDTVFCGGGLNSTVTGTGTSFTYNWSPSTDLSCTNCGNPIASPNILTDYHLEVVDNNNCSATDSIVVNILAIPVEICVVTVDETSTKNELIWEKPVSTAIDSFRVYRDVVGTYQHIASIPYTALSEYIDTDIGINPNATQYRYRISSIDTCGVESPLSSFHQTIHLDAPNFVAGTAELEWQAYDGFPTNFYYRILRDSLSNNDWEVIDSVASSNLDYTDLNVPSTVSTTRYLIEIAFNGTCTSSKAISYGSTRSNKQTVSGGSGGSVSALFTQTSTNISAGQSVIFTDQSIGTPTPNNWVWTFQGGTPNVSNQQNPVVTYNTDGLYDVTLSVGNGSSTDQITKTGLIQVGNVSANTLIGLEKLMIFPNPFSDELSIQIEFNQNADIKLELTALDGRILETKQLFNTKTVSTKMELKNLSSGVYILSIIANDGIMNKRLIKK